MDSRRHLLWLALPLIGVGCALLCLLTEGYERHVVIGYFIGTVLGFATLAAAWTAFGPFPLLVRLPLALLWLVTCIGCIVLNVSMRGGPGIPTILAACIFGQYALLQVPFWALALGVGLRLRPHAKGEVSSDMREFQFGIRQLMIFTALVGVVFGVGRIAVANIGPNLGGGGSDGPIFCFLVIASVLMSLPLLLAGLLPKYARFAVLAVLLLIGLATACELPLLQAFRLGNGPDAYHLVCINGFNSAWILAVVLIARLSGYCLGGRSVTMPIQEMK